jgi:cell filamentation protein
MNDPYLYANSNVLANKAGIKNAKELKTFEQEVTSARSDELGVASRDIASGFGAKHIASIHNFLFQDAYRWAGQFRTVDFEKKGVLYAKANQIPDVLKGMQAELKNLNFLRGLDKEKFVAGLSQTFASLNHAQPFRDGNDKTIRTFITQLAKQAGYSVDFSKISRSEWVEMANAATKNDLAKAKAVFMEITRPTRAIAFESLPEHQALLKHPELVGAYAQKFQGRSVLELISRLDEGGVPGGASAKASAIALSASAAFKQAPLVEHSKMPNLATAKIVAKTEHHALISFEAEKVSVIVNKQALGGKFETGDALRIDLGRDKSLATQAPTNREIGKTIAPALSIQKN